jgi:hypothetical protein
MHETATRPGFHGDSEHEITMAKSCACHDTKSAHARLNALEPEKTPCLARILPSFSHFS